MLPASGPPDEEDGRARTESTCWHPVCARDAVRHGGCSRPHGPRRARRLPGGAGDGRAVPAGHDRQGHGAGVRRATRVAQFAVERPAARIPVVIHCGAADTATAADLARHAEALGVDGVAVVAPYFYGYGTAALFRHSPRCRTCTASRTRATRSARSAGTWPNATSPSTSTRATT